MKFVGLFAVVFCLCGFVFGQDSVEKNIRVEPAKSGEIAYRYFPFDVSANTKSISFEVEYDKKSGANRLEFGVFDERFSGTHADKNGFRGWSGSVRDSFFIGEKEATYGYVSGEIKAGKWYLIIGLASVSPEGFDLKIDIKFDQIHKKAFEQFKFESEKKFTHEESTKPEKITTNNITWFRGDLHTHSYHSDGKWTLEGILDSARSNYLDFVAITDHNTFSHHSEIEELSKKYPEMLILRGEEVTTYGGHINIWGLPKDKWVDFRVLPNMEKSAKKIAAEAREFGALASINHPTMNCYGCNWTYDKTWENLDSVEIWNATWDKDDDEALEMWDKFLQNGKFITAVGSSDSHQPPYEPNTYPINLAIGNPTVFVGAESLNQDKLFEGIRAGRVYIAEKPNYQIKFTANKKYTIGDKIELSKVDKIKLKLSLKNFPDQSEVSFISDGKVIEKYKMKSNKFSKTILFKPLKSNYVRIEIKDENGKMLALTNPIYFQI